MEDTCKLIEAQSKKAPTKEVVQKNILRYLMIRYRIVKMFRTHAAKFEAKQLLLRERGNTLANSALTGFAGKDETADEELVNTRGMLEFGQKNYSKPDELEKIKSNPTKVSFDKLYFSLTEDIIAWKKKPTGSNVEGKIFLNSIEEIKAVGAVFFYVVSSLKSDIS